METWQLVCHCSPSAVLAITNKFYLVCDLQLLSLALSLPLCLCLHFFLPVRPLCAGHLQKLKCLTQSLINLNRLRWLAQTPQFHLSHQAASLMLKGEAKGSGLLCVLFISSSSSFLCSSVVYSIMWVFFPLNLRHSFDLCVLPLD